MSRIAKTKRQIWCYRDSPALALIEPLRGRYSLHAAPRSAAPADPTARGGNGAPAVWLADLARDDVASLGDLARREPSVRLIGVVRNAATPPRRARGANEPPLFAYLPGKAPRALVEKTIDAAFENIELAARERAAQEDLARAEREMDELNRIGVALSSQHDMEKLLNLILLKAREITGADAGSLYLVEESESGERRLRFMLTQNDSRNFPFSEFDLPLAEDSMAGYVALRGEALNLPDAYRLPAGCPYRFNVKYDDASGYRTRSLLTLPMKNAKGDVTGVLQLINRKRNPAMLLERAEDVEREVEPFPQRAVRLALSLASQAAVAYENSKLYEEIESLFEGFVKAAVTAIEQRDPTTSGHSLRVSTLTQGLAETVDRAGDGPYSATRFSFEQMKEIRYAALLHDFGKVGVREEVLVKAKKLYPFQIELVRQRFDYIRKELEARVTRQKLEAALERSREEALTRIGTLDQDYERALREIDDYLQFILEVNEPTLLQENKFERLVEIARRSFRDPRGIERPFLNPDEVGLLSIPKGSLDPDERRQIESHVIHTFNFLTQIPWTKELKAVPSIARAHHEKLDGTGYPYRLKRLEIPLPAKMMTVCDIFDALSASDRPYKKAVPVERALTILDSCVRENALDAELLRLFIEAKVYARTVKQA